MIKRFPDSIAARTLLTLFFGLTLSHIASIVVFTSEKMEVMALTNEGQALGRMATITRLLLEVPEAYHPSILSTVNDSLLQVKITSASQTSAPQTFANDPDLRSRLSRLLAGTPTQVIAVSTHKWGEDSDLSGLYRFALNAQMMIIRLMHGEAMDREITVHLVLPGGKEVTFICHPFDRHPPVFGHAAISVTIMAAAIFLFSLLVVRHLTTPLNKVVQAAETLGRDVYAPPLVESGPHESRVVARAFNDMNRKIREYVEDRTQMIAAISHDLRTPITQLRLRAEFIEDDEERGRFLATLSEMEAMLRATLFLARDQAEREAKRVVDLAGLLSSICDDMADTGQPVRFEHEGKLPYPCRPLAMKRALTNVIENSVKYGEEAEVSILTENDWLVITVQDRGPGIPENEWDNVFRPFYRVDQSRSRETGGAGLGLSVTASVIRDHFGTVSFEKLDGDKPAFLTRLRLPLNPGGATATHST
ncbi:histidine kinase [uncultured Gammaproteobacteria bacterium]